MFGRFGVGYGSSPHLIIQIVPINPRRTPCCVQRYRRISKADAP